MKIKWKKLNLEKKNLSNQKKKWKNSYQQNQKM